MVTIVAIGGGEIGRPKKEGGRYPIETRKIDERIIELTGKKNPKALLLPTASGDSETYFPTFQRYYGKILGCQTDVLYLLRGKLTKEDIQKKIDWADIIYVGGGNTLKMMKTWRRMGLDKILLEASQTKKVLCGVSAGAICWFEYGQSDSMKFGPKKEEKLIRVRGLGLIPGLICPHYDFEKNRRPSLHEMVSKYSISSVALDNCTALEYLDGESNILTSKRNARAFRVYSQKGKVYEEIIS